LTNSLLKSDLSKSAGIFDEGSDYRDGFLYRFFDKIKNKSFDEVSISEFKVFLKTIKDLCPVIKVLDVNRIYEFSFEGESIPVIGHLMDSLDDNVLMEILLSLDLDKIKEIEVYKRNITLLVLNDKIKSFDYLVSNSIVDINFCYSGVVSNLKNFLARYCLMCPAKR